MEQSSVVWNSLLTRQSTIALGRVQREAVRKVLEGTHSYKEGKTILNIATLKERRKILTARFENKCLTSKNTSECSNLTV